MSGFFRAVDFLYTLLPRGSENLNGFEVLFWNIPCFIPGMKLLALLLPLIPIFASSAFAGDAHGGGSNDVVATFLAEARRVLARYPGPSEERDALREAVENSRIIAVKTLLDPISGLPIQNQEKNPAWGSPGLIQLKLDSGIPGEDSFEKMLREKKPVLHHVTHELFRASKLCEDPDASKCPDDDYKKTVFKYHLDSAPEWRFPDAIPNVNTLNGELILANGPLFPLKVVSGVFGAVTLTLSDSRTVHLFRGGASALNEVRSARMRGESLALVGTGCSANSSKANAEYTCLGVRLVRPEKLAPKREGQQPASSAEPISDAIDVL